MRNSICVFTEGLRHVTTEIHFSLPLTECDVDLTARECESDGPLWKELALLLQLCVMRTNPPKPQRLSLRLARVLPI